MKMNNLNSTVKVISLNPVVWYSPSSFPTISTDAVIVDGDGELLLINPGWGYKLIHVSQIVRIISSYRYETEELQILERIEYDNDESYKTQ